MKPLLLSPSLLLPPPIHHPIDEERRFRQGRDVFPLTTTTTLVFSLSVNLPQPSSLYREWDKQQNMLRLGTNQD